MKLFGTLCIFCLLLHISPNTAWCVLGFIGSCPETVNEDVVLSFTLKNGDELVVSFTQDKFDDFLGYICDTDVELTKVKLGDELAVRKFETDYGTPSNLKTWCTVAVRDFLDYTFLGLEFSTLELRRCQHDNYWSRYNEKCGTISRNDNGCNNAEVSVPLGAFSRLKVAEDAQICTVCKKGDDCYNSGVTSPDITDDGIGMEVISTTTTPRFPKSIITTVIQGRTTESKSPGRTINTASQGEGAQLPIVLGVAIVAGILLLIVVIVIVAVILWKRRRPQKDQQDTVDDISNPQPNQTGLDFVNAMNEMLEAEYQGHQENGHQSENPKNEMLEAEYEYLSYPAYCQQK